ncbi:uncharacterized protein LOC105636431 isoform X2 [Jatropha curcas]|uniref:uncharacterized protein LOC105636431 isoform X2 n=1 Tax=Jatropha curcas TaxID=180498 RepID=UPI0005FAB398|nr:uncharacterized protein LOC105636431 isoform X2 [Jatropha curcas]
MGKEGELWDDSALIKAFDDAKMHGKKSKDTSIDASAITNQTQAHETRDADEKTNVASELGVDENHCVDYSSSSQQQVQAVTESDYNQLLAEYYDVEEKRQRILQQLGSYDYQHSQHMSSVACSCCCPYVSHCSLGGTCPYYSSAVEGPTKHAPPNLIDVDIVQTAMGAAERAISSINTLEKEKEKGKGSEEKVAQSTNSETDLSVVLNAWYSAGFYTGKYLTEQSIMKK